MSQELEANHFQTAAEAVEDGDITRAQAAAVLERDLYEVDAENARRTA